MIEIKDLTKYYGERKALGPLSCSIGEGEIVGLLGLNGAGKTTTLRILACDLLPSSGRVLVDGLDVVDHPREVRARIGYLPDHPPLHPEMTVREYLAFAAKIRGVDSAKVGALVEEAIATTQLESVAEDPISSLSHGFKQRVGIAQAIVHKPKLLVLDEPITGLDPVQIVEMRELIKRLKGEATILLSSHILSEISETCDRILVIKEGTIGAEGTEAELSTKLLEGGSVTITVRGDAAKAKETISGVDGVATCDAIHATEPGEDVTTFAVTSERDARAAIVKALVGAGLDVLGVGKSERELESVFLRLSGKPATLLADGLRPHAAEKPS